MVLIIITKTQKKQMVGGWAKLFEFDTSTIVSKSRLDGTAGPAQN